MRNINMTSEVYNVQAKFRRFGKILILLGIVPIGEIVLALWGYSLSLNMGLFYYGYFSEGLFPQFIFDLVTIVCLLLLVINNKKIRDRTDTVEFRSYYLMITLYFFLFLAGNLLYHYGCRIPIMKTTWKLILIIYDVILLVASIFELLAWIRLSQYAITIHYPFNTYIKKGSIILAVAAGFSIALFLLDLSSLLTDSLYFLEYLGIIYLIISNIGLVIYMVGCIKTGNDIKQAWISNTSTEPT